jgi:hypothetical protein
MNRSIHDMGDMQVLKEQLEIGMPFESAALLAGFSFEEIEALADDEKINRIVEVAEATLMSRHLLNVNEKSDDNPRMSTWMLERKFPNHFSPTTKIQTPDDGSLSVEVKGVFPEEEKKKKKK